jgi:hypothetical protein
MKATGTVGLPEIKTRSTIVLSVNSAKGLQVASWLSSSCMPAIWKTRGVAGDQPAKEADCLNLEALI